MSRRRWSAVALATLVPLGAAPALASDSPGAAAARPALRVSGSPALIPRFDPAVVDYVARCRPGKRLRLSVAAPPGTRVSVARARPRKRSFSARVRVSSGQSISVVATTGRRRRRYFVRCLPPDFPKWTSETPGRPQAAWYVVAPCCTKQAYVAIFDTHGVPVWWINTHRPPLDASLLPDGHVVWAQQHGKDFGLGVSSGAYEEHALDGRLVRTFSIPGGIPTDRHELQLLPNGDYVVVAYRPRKGVDLSPYGGPARATVLDALVDEVTPKGKVVWSWRSNRHVALSETGRWYQQGVLANPVHLHDGTPAYDIVHINAVQRYGPGHFLISLRHTDAIYSVARAGGAVQWKLGGTQTPRSLRIEGDDVPDFGGQHDVRLLPDGTITLHDNGTGLGRLPRALRFRIDPQAMTATLVEQLSDPDSGESTCCGSVRRLPGGHWVISWGGTHLVEELTDAGKRVFALHFPQHISYRAFPVLPGRLAARALRAGMNATHPRAP